MNAKTFKKVSDIKTSDEYIEACSLAMSLFNAHYKYKSGSVQIELLDDTAGVISQIDNMAAGLAMDLYQKEQEIDKLKKELDYALTLARVYCDGKYTRELDICINLGEQHD